MKVLVVDDSSAMVGIISGAVKKLGVQDVATANDGIQALAEVGKSEPDLILLDWNMPNMNGMEFLEKYRKAGKAGYVVMITTEAEKPRIVQAIRTGANDYFIKPFTPDSLRDKLSSVFSKLLAA